MGIALLAIVSGLVLLVISADKFIEGSAMSALYFHVSPLLIGMVIVGFGSSAPELVVSVMAASRGNPGIAIGNAFGSNIVNIALILGITALIKPIMVSSSILKKELPLLVGVIILTYVCIRDLTISRLDGIILILGFMALMVWTVHQSKRETKDTYREDLEKEQSNKNISLTRALFYLFFGIIFLIISSRLLVWGSVEITTLLGVSEVITGLTVVAIGTSLPELASCIAAVKKGEDDIALGNIIGSYLFNTLLVVGLASSISPFKLDQIIIIRDFLFMAVLTLSLFIIGYRWKKGVGRINRYEGLILLLSYIVYVTFLIISAFPTV
ncbi:MAG: calcium/sodium antiporter [Spirochaetia bacterium]|nr:calcium/sodium antiporter [Spirochaetia bacterium]